MKKITVVFFTFFATVAYSQKNDNVWVFGYYYGQGYSVPGLDFYWGAPDTVGFYPPFDFIASGCVSMSDASGNLQFYTNGNEVGNWNNHIIQNSANYNSDGVNYYNQFWQGEISIPFPDHPNEYVIFHLYGTYTANWLYPLNVFYSVIDMSANGGEGTMTQKQISVISDTLLPCSMQATRHANGRDWWIVIHKANSNVFREFLFTPNGVFQSATLATGPFQSVFNISEGQSAFSPDGSMYAIAYNTNNGVYLYDFDRCTGAITYRDSSHITPNDPDEWPVWGCSFSPNSRYLYATTNNDLYQFDTWSTVLDSGKKIVGTFDGFADPFPNYFFRHCPGPDGKIYMTCWGGSRFLHVINSPDLGDTLCDFGQHQIQLVSYHASTLPEFPNYRLGAINGSSCDSIYLKVNTEIDDNYFLRVTTYENKLIRVTYKIDKSETCRLSVYDISGRKVFQTYVSGGSHALNVDLSNLREGLYLAVLTGKSEYQSEKFTLLQ